MINFTGFNLCISACYYRAKFPVFFIVNSHFDYPSKTHNRKPIP